MSYSIFIRSKETRENAITNHSVTIRTT